MKRHLWIAAGIVLLAACGKQIAKPEKHDGPTVVERTYAKPAGQVCDAVIACIKAMELHVDDDRHDKLGGDIVARRSNGDRVLVEVRSVDAKQSKVVVRVDPGNGNLAEVLHEKIAAKLGPGAAKASGAGEPPERGR